MYRRLCKTIGPFVRNYSRLKLLGTEHLPAADQPAILASNHGGSLWWDALCLAAGLRDRQVRFVAHHWDARNRLMASFLRSVDAHLMPERFDQVTSDHAIVESLNAGELICVYPEESYHTFRDRYTLFEFNPQILRYAQLTGAPIVPTAMIGVEEAAATLLGWKRKGVPLHFPWLPPVILPLKVQIQFAPAISFAELTGCDPQDALRPADYQRGSRRLREILRETIHQHRPCRTKDIPYLEVASLW